MFDAQLKAWIDRPLADAAGWVAPLGIRANWVTIAGGAVAFVAMLLVSRGHGWIAVGFVLLNRVLDGLDGPLARATGGATQRGAYLDAVFDTLFFASLPFGFALAEPEKAVAAVFLLLGLIVLGAASWTMVEKRGAQGEPLGMAEALVVTVIYVAVCAFPGWFSIAAYVLGLIAFILAGVRVASAVNTLS
jgi:phosphatidylglycerophosphate synthase